jgi:predicted dehydrogenase
MELRKLRGGMIGGGIGAFIGPVHRMAATLDGQAEWIAGAFSSDPAKSTATGKSLFLDPARTYPDWRTMLKAESGRTASERIDFVSIVTPNSTHFAIAKACLESGFHVVCDKPMCTSLAQARELESVVAASGRVFALTHNYTGYPMVKQARHMVRAGALGPLNKVVVEYPQGWLSGMLTAPQSGISGWRSNPELAGTSCCVGDIGIHAENLARYVTGLEIESVCADVSSFIPGGKLEDDASVLLRFKGGAKGVLLASQISTGEENGLRLRIYGTKAGMSWSQEDPNYLDVKDPSGFRTVYSKGNAVLCEAAKKAGRLPFGHPDGFIEAFANIYLEAFRSIRDAKSGPEYDHPTVRDGVIGNAFIETVLESGRSENKWVRMKA